ncbi:LuxR C-terminal-related transcriptional regulator [Leucobacter iarius]|uniref:HTH luxR-type domain-containing protein n=1 Tax=Leucobacter iarius TaxID=333963 RepID=A0ABN2LQ97_9MICO
MTEPRRAVPVPRFFSVERERLFPRPAEDGEPAPLTIFCAPMGMGKTVLASQWLRSDVFDGVEVHWTSCLDADGDAGSLWRFLAEALRPDAPLGGGSGSPRSAAGPGDWFRAAQRAVERLDRRVMLVIDDYQELTSIRTDRDLARLISMSPLLLVTVLSHTLAGLDGPTVLSGLTAVEVDAGQLPFTLEETRELAARYGIDADYAARLHHEAAGWPLPIREVLQQIAGGATEGRIAARVRRFLEEYAAAPMSELGLRVLTLSAVCDRISLDLLASAVESSAVELEAALDELGRLGLITRHWYPEQTRLRCHPGLRAVLRARAVRELDEPELHRLRFRHAMDLGGDDPSRAVALLLEIEEYGDAARLLASFYPEGIGPNGEALIPLRGIPLARLREHPYLIGAHLLTEIGQGRCTRSEAEGMHRALLDAIAGREAVGDTELAIPTGALLITVERMRGDVGEALRRARELAQRMERARLSDDEAGAAGIPPEGVSVIYSAIAISALLSGDADLAERCFARALDAAERAGSGAKQHRALNGLAFAAAAKGETRRARGYLARIESLELVMDGAPSQFSVMSGVSARLMIAIEDRDLDTIARLLDTVEPVRNRTSEWSFFAMAEAELLRQEDVLAAVARLDRRVRDAERIFDTSSFTAVWLDAYAARMLAKAGNLGAAERRLAALDPEHPAVLVSRAALSLLEEDLAAAVAVATRFLRLRLPVWETIAGQAVRGVARWELGARDAAVADFTVAAGLVLEHASTSALEMLPYESLRELAAETARRGGPDLGAVVDAIPEALRYRQFEALTPAELRTLEALGAGPRTMAEVAEELFVTPHTVKFHMRSVYRKLGAGGRDEALRRARQMGLIAPERAPEYHL